MLQLVSWNHTAIVLVSSLRFGLAVVEIAAMSARYPRVLFAYRCVLLLQLICGHAVLMGRSLPVLGLIRCVSLQLHSGPVTQTSTPVEFLDFSPSLRVAGASSGSAAPLFSTTGGVVDPVLGFTNVLELQGTFLSTARSLRIDIVDNNGTGEASLSFKL
jgi:hypothetical protein